MPIEVHCPNPTCAKVHFVKDKYAGMRGKCPACAAWMYIPNQAPPAVLAATRAQPQPPPEEEVQPLPQEEEELVHPLPATRKKAAAVDEEEAWADTRQARPMKPRAEEEEAVEAEVEPPAASRPYFSWLAIALLVLGMLSVLGVSATAVKVDGSPVVEQSVIAATGEFRERYGENRPRQDILDQLEFYVLTVPIGVAVLALLGVLVAVVMRQFGFVPTFLGVLSTLAALILFLAFLHVFRAEALEKDRIEAAVKVAQEKGATGEVTVSLGLYLWVGLASAGAATLFFLLGTMFMYRRWWGSLMVLLFISALAGLGVGTIYAKELGMGAILD
jgi:hypothetical protein